MSDPEAGCIPYALQAGGHSAKSGAAPASLLDQQGRFLKKLQADDRGARELAFYAFMEQHRQQQQPDASAPQQQHDCSTCVNELQHSLMCQLAQWVPQSYGTQQVLGQSYLVLEDVAGRYRQPCVLDIKMGYSTAYAWASEARQGKYRSKDAATTQSSLGFRLCGMVVQQAAANSSNCMEIGNSSSVAASSLQRVAAQADVAQPTSSSAAAEAAGTSTSQLRQSQQQEQAKVPGASCSSAGGAGGVVLRRDRHWGKQLSADDMGAALRSFADNGALSLADLCLGPHGLLQQLQCLANLFEQQQCWHFYSASLLVVYEGAATSAAEAGVCVKLIDFAHAFPCSHPGSYMQQTSEQPVQGVGQHSGLLLSSAAEAGSSSQGPNGPDTNFLGGLRSLMSVLQGAM